MQGVIGEKNWSSFKVYRFERKTLAQQLKLPVTRKQAPATAASHIHRSLPILPIGLSSTLLRFPDNQGNQLCIMDIKYRHFTR
jgi:hypothetical protein